MITVNVFCVSSAVTDDLKNLVIKLENRVNQLEKSCSPAPAAAAAPKPAAPVAAAAKKADNDDDDVDLFGSDSDDEEQDAEKVRRSLHFLNSVTFSLAKEDYRDFSLKSAP